MEGLKSWLFEDKTEEELYRWLNLVLDRSYDYLTENEVLEYRVLPNQEGKFLTRFVEQHNDGLWETVRVKLDVTKTEELKEILHAFSDKCDEYNIYRETVDRRILLKNIKHISLHR
jgi:hypothetical protein